MQREVRDLLRDRCNFDDVEIVDHDDFEWTVNVHTGSQNEYTVSVYKDSVVDHLVIQSSARLDDTLASLIDEMSQTEIMMIQRDLILAGMVNGIDVIPEDRQGSEIPLPQAQVYSFYQYLFPEDYTPSKMIQAVSRSMNIVDLAFVTIWCYS